MLSEEKMQRINELAKKSKTVGLTNKESEEQQALRKEYLQTFRNAFKQQLHSVTVVDEQGTDVTPTKLKNSKKQNDKFIH